MRWKSDGRGTAQERSDFREDSSSGHARFQHSSSSSDCKFQAEDCFSFHLKLSSPWILRFHNCNFSFSPSINGGAYCGSWSSEGDVSTERGCHDCCVQSVPYRSTKWVSLRHHIRTWSSRTLAGSTPWLYFSSRSLLFRPRFSCLMG
jgi:hypothetical protein